jgi:Resolvase, N terminal domain/Helix-turn-helix domain of resolvase
MLVTALCAAAKPAPRLKATEQPIDTSTAAGKCFLDMLGVFAEFETNLRRERQLEGIAKAKAAGVYKGRPASIDAAEVRAMKAQGLGASEIAKALKIGRPSVYRAHSWPGLPTPVRERACPPSFFMVEEVMNTDVAPPLAANMTAAFKKVRGAIGATDPDLADLIVTRIVELAKAGVYDVEELSSRTLSSLKSAG